MYEQNKHCNCGNSYENEMNCGCAREQDKCHHNDRDKNDWRENKCCCNRNGMENCCCRRTSCFCRFFCR